MPTPQDIEMIIDLLVGLAVEPEDRDEVVAILEDLTEEQFTDVIEVLSLYGHENIPST